MASNVNSVSPKMWTLKVLPQHTTIQMVLVQCLFLHRELFLFLDQSILRKSTKAVVARAFWSNIQLIICVIRCLIMLLPVALKLQQENI